MGKIDGERENDSNKIVVIVLKVRVIIILLDCCVYMGVNVYYQLWIDC